MKAFNAPQRSVKIKICPGLRREGLNYFEWLQTILKVKAPDNHIIGCYITDQNTGIVMTLLATGKLKIISDKYWPEYTIY